MALDITRPLHVRRTREPRVPPFVATAAYASLPDKKVLDMPPQWFTTVITGRGQPHNAGRGQPHNSRQ